jgi:ABC-type nitrate/sulfonate/bicarbonate transport system ATPase subunit
LQAFFIGENDKMKKENEITLIVGKLGVGKSTLASYALDQYDKALVLTNFPEDFDCHVTQDLNEIIEFENKKVCFLNDNLTENEIAMTFAYEMGNRLLIIDEAHLYQDSQAFKKIMRYSRHKRLDVILISHSLFDFARMNRSLVHNIISFKMTEAYELSHMERINDKMKPGELKEYQFVILQGDIPTWLNKKDLTFKENILMLNLKA